MTKLQETFKARKRLLRVLLLIGISALLGFLVLGFVSIQVWEATNSAAFCTGTCHDVHPEEPLAYQDSHHAQVKCTECHMGRVSTLEALMLKTTHARHLPQVIFHLYERPLESASMRPANETCERCHTPSAFHDDTARQIRRFLPDENNTEQRTYLLLRTGTGATQPDQGYGIHWHISNQVEYIATDEHKQDIRWIRATLPDGRVVEYNDAQNPLSAGEIQQAEKRTMDCVDCHNRVGHPFPAPEILVDQALADGRLSPDLPFAKRQILAVLSADYASQADALAAADGIRTRYREADPDLALERMVEIEGAIRLAKELIPQVIFEEPGVTWDSFPDNDGHRGDAGCFRCHDGRHLSQEGEPIRLGCSLCHSIPMTADAGEAPPEMSIVWQEAPASHLEATFLNDHRYQASDDCTKCHDEIRFGDDDSTFCANSACHGQDWAIVDLDALFPHSVQLEGGHAETACYTCHNGVRNISYDCATCHEVPEAPHYGSACQDCHTPTGFALASADGFDHPVALDGGHTNLDCDSCHMDGKPLSSDCVTCHTAPEDHLAGSCDACHTPSGWAESAVYAMAMGDKVPHATSAGDDCMACHDPAAQNWPAPSNHLAFTDDQCTLCHAAGGFGPAVTISHDGVPELLQGQHNQLDCIQCHGDGLFQGTPQECITCHQDDDRHAGQLGTDCRQCHTPSGWALLSFDHAQVGFALLGQHQNVACQSCHAGGTFAGTPQTCYACHQADDRHAGQFGLDCAQCHDPRGWGGASIDHNTTGFALTGAHTAAACSQCHINNTYAGTPKNCYACHQTDDPHAGQFGQDCAQCHDTGSWGGASIDHSATGFALTGAHTAAACSQCHTNGTYAGTPKNCYTCHQTDDRHAGQFGQNCAQCHNTGGWGGASIDHNATGFALNGAHTGVDCSQCHTNGTYAGTPQNCYACHQTDDRHAGQFGQDCAQCHDTGGWGGASIDHNATGFPLTGAHTGVDCTQCHISGTYAGTPQNCYACHQSADRHAGQFGQTCAQCHDTGGWGGASIDHSATGFPLTGAHAGANCTQCHSNGSYAGTPKNCYACHQTDDRHAGQFGQDCAQCHDTGSWGGASIDHNATGFPLTGAHAGANCAQCHPNGSYAGTPTACAACHGEPAYHAGQLGTECASCHNTGGWLPASYDRGHTFPLNHEGASADCRTCHPDQLAGYTCYTCHSAGEIDEEHDEEGVRDYSNCVACHPTGREP